jgi:MFS family permease
MFPRDFWRYLASRFAGAAAMMLFRAAVAWHVYDLSHSAFQLGLNGLVQFLPVPVLMLVGGAVADTYERRKVMMAAGAVALVCAVALCGATATGVVSVPMLFAMVALASAAWSFDGPARAALLPTLVPRQIFPRAVTIASTTQALAFATGPALGGLVIAEWGIAAAYATMALLVVLALVLLAGLRLPVHAPAAGVLSIGGIVAGLRFVRGNQVVLGCMLLDMLAVVFGGAVALLPMYATDILHVGARGYGLLTASADLGALLTSVILVVAPPIRRAGRALLVAVAVYGVATIAFGLSESLLVTMLCLAAVGAADTVNMVLRNVIRQLHTPDHLRGRMVAVNIVFAQGGPQLGELEAGIVAQLWGPVVSVVSGGIGCLLATGGMARFATSLRDYGADERRPVPADVAVAAQPVRAARPLAAARTRVPAVAAMRSTA